MDHASVDHAEEHQLGVFESPGPGAADPAGAAGPADLGAADSAGKKKRKGAPREKPAAFSSEGKHICCQYEAH